MNQNNKRFAARCLALLGNCSLRCPISCIHAVVAALVFVWPLTSAACGDLTPDPATVPPVVRAPAL